MSERPRTDALPLPAKLGLLAALYIAQGLPFGFFTQTLPAVMRARGYRLTEISYAALLSLPWALKFLWAPLVDRYPAPTPTVRARRTRWILACQAAATLAFVGLAIWGRLDHLPPLFVGFAVLNLISATQDVATDGLAVDTLVGAERGHANGIQVAGYRGGMVAGGGLLLLILDRVGARGAFILLAAATLLLSIPLLSVREAPPRLASEQDRPEPRAPHFLTLRGVGPILLVLVTFKLAESLLAGVMKPFFVDRGLKLAEIGVSGIVGSTGGLIGALIGGALASRLGRRPALISAALLQTATVFLFAIAVVLSFDRNGLIAIYFVEAFGSSLATATLFTVMMDWSRPLVGATDYTVQASTIVVAGGLTALVSGRIADALGYQMYFITAGLVGVGSVLILLFFYPKGPPQPR